jgi:hypothetical protein
VIVIDDHTLVAVLAENAGPELEREADRNESLHHGKLVLPGGPGGARPRILRFSQSPDGVAAD